MTDTVLTLYHFEGCPYCSLVEHAASRLGVAVERRDIHRDPGAMDELLAARGRRTVPVLRIEDADGERWMPESADIVAFLEERYGDGEPVARNPLTARWVQPAMWALLIFGGVLGDGWRGPLWMAATGLAAARSLSFGWMTGAWHHFLVGGMFAFATLSIGLSEAGVAELPWSVAALAVAAVVLGLRGLRTRAAV